MKKKQTLLKELITGYEQNGNRFLSLLDENGTILNANARMIKSFRLPHPRKTPVNFYDLVHPIHLDTFRKTLLESGKGNGVITTELYLKNGHYHPMKWRISCLEGAETDQKKFLCAGFRLLDDERMEKFNRLGGRNYHDILECLNEGVLFQDQDGELISANYSAAEIFGATLERLYELKDVKSMWDTDWMITDEEGQKVPFDNTPFMQAVRTGEPVAAVLNIQLRRGGIRSILFKSQPLFEDTKNTVQAVITSLSDLTRQEELSSQLREREALFNEFMQRTPNLAWVVDEDANLVVASQSFYKYFKLDEGKAAGEKIAELIPAEVEGSLFVKHMEVLRTGKPVQITEKVRLANGTMLVFHIQIFPINGVGNKKLLGGHAVNIAEKDVVEKQLQEANERLLLLTRATSDAIWEWDMQSGTIFRNDTLIDMIGYAPEEKKGLTWWLRRIHPDDRNRVSDKIKESADAGRQSWEDEYRFKCADGTYKYMHDKGYIVYENGLPVRMIGSLQDVSDIRKLKDELTEQKLVRQKEISETVIRAQEKERTRIGHELHDNVNQILSTTKLFVDMLTPGTGEENKIKEKSIQYLVLAIEEIRKLSRELVTPQLKNKTLVESVQQLIDDIVVSTKLRVKFTYDHDIELLSPGKKITLFRIVQEQMKNVLKYSQADQADVLLLHKDGQIVLSIKDNGAGFDTEKPVRGIGLQNIRERTRFYNGEVKLMAAPGQGCTLEVFLPLPDEEISHSQSSEEL